MPKLIGHAPRPANRPRLDLPLPERKRLLKIPYSQKALIPQNQIFYELDTSDRGGARRLAKRWYRWYALPECIAHASNATDNMIAKAAPKCHVTW